MTLLPEVRRQLREAAERQAGSGRQRLRSRGLFGTVARGRPGHRLSYLVPVLSVVLALVVAAVFIGARGGNRPAGSRSGESVTVAFVALPTAQVPVVTKAALSRTVEIMRERLASVFTDVQISSSGRTLVVLVRHAPPGARARVVALSAAARLEFYDWEATALTPNGKTVASQLHAQDPHAVAISQGSGSAAPGEPGAGSMTLYDAVRLASRQPALHSADRARPGSQYYLFGAPGSAACAAAARDRGTTPSPGAHCLLAGPGANKSELLSSAPQGVSTSQGQMLVVPAGVIVVQAADLSATQQTNPSDPTAQFYVLRDHVSLFGNEITHPRQRTDQSGNPDVTFGFSATGATAFRTLTAEIARRGGLVSGLGATFNQHFAIALDNKLITVPQIDFKTYPSGIPGNNGADIAGGFTVQSAENLAIQLSRGALPLNLQAQ